MPAGDPAGHDDVLPIPQASTRVAPTAPVYDMATRDYRVNDDGTYASVESIDSEVEHRLGMLQGWLGSSPSVGSRLRKIVRLDDSLDAQVLTLVREALAGLLDRGDVSVGPVSTSLRTYGGYVADITVKNLRTNASKAHAVSFST